MFDADAGEVRRGMAGQARQAEGMTEFDMILDRLATLETLILKRDQAPPPWFDLKQASRYSSLSKSTLTRAVQAGTLKASRRHGKTLIRVIDLDNFLAGRR